MTFAKDSRCMSDSNTILPTAQITGLEQGLDHELAALEAALNSQIYLENLPIIGTQLGAAFKQGQAALKKISVLEANVKQALTNLNNLPNVTLGNLQSAINGAVSSAGFANTVLTTLDSGSLTLKFNNSASATFNEALGSNFGVARPELRHLRFGTDHGRLQPGHHRDRRRLRQFLGFHARPRACSFADPRRQGPDLHGERLAGFVGCNPGFSEVQRGRQRLEPERDVRDRYERQCGIHRQCQSRCRTRVQHGERRASLGQRRTGRAGGRSATA